MLILFYHLIIIMKIVISMQIFHNCLCVCFLDCSKVRRNILFSFDKPTSKCKNPMRNVHESLTCMKHEKLHHIRSFS